LRASCFSVPRDEPPFSNEELAAALVLANQYQLNPFAKELFCFRGKGGKINAGPTIDGWIKIATRHPEFDGEDFEEVHDEEGNLVSCTCIMHRRGRSRPTRVTEYLKECQDTTKDTWRKWPHRMLRHRAFGQAVRVCFGLTSLGADREPAMGPEAFVPTVSFPAEPPASRVLDAPRGRMVTSSPLPEPVGVQVSNGAPEESAQREPGQEG
jgi:hypothetical protein